MTMVYLLISIGLANSDFRWTVGPFTTVEECDKLAVAMNNASNNVFAHCQIKVYR